MLGSRLTRSENIYEPNHIQYTESHRTKIAKELTRNEFLNLERNMEMMSNLISIWLDIIYEEKQGKE